MDYDENSQPIENSVIPYSVECLLIHPGKPHVQISEGVGYRR